MYASKLVMSRSAVRVRSSALFIPCKIRKLHKGVNVDDRETIGQSVLARTSGRGGRR